MVRPVSQSMKALCMMCVIGFYSLNALISSVLIQKGYQVSFQKVII